MEELEFSYSPNGDGVVVQARFSGLIIGQVIPPKELEALLFNMHRGSFLEKKIMGEMN